MKTVQTIEALLDEREKLTNPVGIVPTMGYLHQGHLSLVQKAKENCKSIIVTIYVNPTQFGQNEDLSTYPRDIGRDLALLKNEQVDLVWMPEDGEMYPPEFQTWVSVNKLTSLLEGKSRPTHFQGVTTIVAKLFIAARPQFAYFGQKDAQQAIVIQRMVKDLNFPVKIEVCPIVREPDGLAMSSRNKYLNDEQRNAAPILYRSLMLAREAFDNGERDAERLKSLVMNLLDSQPLVNVQYLSLADLSTLSELDGPIKKGLLSMAVFIGKTRLIDNIVLK
jgi:pantoate--beta-alanine ligase